MLHALCVLRKPALDFDGIVKLLIQGSGGEPFRQLGLGRVKEWLNVDLPRTQHLRADLLCRTTDERLIHIELQATNDPSMPYRMAEYALTIRRMFKRYPEQVVLYVGNEPLRMKAGFRTPAMLYRYLLVDIRDLDGAALLRSDSITDNILAMLARLENSAEGIRIVLERIAKLKDPSRELAMQQFLLTCGLRGLESVATKEVQEMPITTKFDYRKYPFLVAAVEEARDEAREEAREAAREEARAKVLQAREEALQKGRQEGIKKAVRLQLKSRFGRIPASVTKRLTAMSEAEAQQLLLGIFDAKSLEDLFAGSHR